MKKLVVQDAQEELAVADAKLGNVIKVLNFKPTTLWYKHANFIVQHQTFFTRSSLYLM